MSRYTVPSITKIEEVLDLMLEPAKYAALLSELTTLHADITQALGVLTTKDEADRVLSAAYDKLEQVNKEVENKQEALQESLTAKASAMDAEAHTLVLRSLEQDTRQQALDELDRSLMKKYAEQDRLVRDQGEALARREEQVSAKFAEAEKLMTEAVALKEKHEKVARALGLVGV